MQSQGWHEHWPAILIIAWIVDVLQTRGDVDSAPNVGGIIGFHDVFAAITERAVTEQEAESSVGKINLMIFRDVIGNDGHACAVVSAMPQRTVGAQASGKGLINFRVGKGLRFAVIPSETGEGGEVSRDVLLQVDAQAVLARDMPWVIRYVRSGNKASGALSNGLAINAHVCVLREGQSADHAWLSREQTGARVICEVLGMRLPGLPHQVDSVGYPRHQALGETEPPITIFVVRGDSDRVAARIGGVIVSTVVVDGPIRKLKMGIRTHGILVEEIDHAEFSKADFQAPTGKLLEQG